MRIPYLRALFTIWLVSLGACDRAPRPLVSMPDQQPLALAAPDRDFRLPAADRQKVRKEFDPDALERLLGMIRPDMRRAVLRNFQALSADELEPGERPGWITRFTEPQLTAVLEEVYQPAWDQLPDSVLAEPGSILYPGRELARKRRDERKQAGRPGAGP
jgi:hypothetical protein